MDKQDQMLSCSATKTNIALFNSTAAETDFKHVSYSNFRFFLNMSKYHFKFITNTIQIPKKLYIKGAWGLYANFSSFLIMKVSAYQIIVPQLL